MRSTQTRSRTTSSRMQPATVVSTTTTRADPVRDLTGREFAVYAWQGTWGAGELRYSLRGRDRFTQSGGAKRLMIQYPVKEECPTRRCVETDPAYISSQQ